MVEDKDASYEHKIGEAETLGKLKVLLGLFRRDFPIRYDNKGPIEVFLHKDSDRDGVIILR